MLAAKNNQIMTLTNTVNSLQQQLADYKSHDVTIATSVDQNFPSLSLQTNSLAINDTNIHPTASIMSSSLSSSSTLDITHNNLTFQKVKKGKNRGKKETRLLDPKLLGFYGKEKPASKVCDNTDISPTREHLTELNSY